MEKSTARSAIGREWTIEHKRTRNEQIGQKEQKKNSHAQEVFPGTSQ
jgi:hypothetical protein